MYFQEWNMKQFCCFYWISRQINRIVYAFRILIQVGSETPWLCTLHTPLMATKRQKKMHKNSKATKYMDICSVIQKLTSPEWGKKWGFRATVWAHACFCFYVRATSRRLEPVWCTVAWLQNVSHCSESFSSGESVTLCGGAAVRMALCV